MIKTEQRTVTPKQAKEWLEQHYERIATDKFRQRRVMGPVIARYANDMAQGFWQLCPQPISFDEAGNLLDGQHRLEAVVRHGKPVDFMVSTGWEVVSNGLSAMDIIDRGKSRTVGQQLQIHGYINSLNYAGCVTATARMLSAGSCSVSLSSCLFILEQLDFRSHIDRIKGKVTNQRDFRGRVVGPMAFYHTAYPRKAEEFAEEIFGFATKKDSPTNAYLKWRSGYAMNKDTDRHIRAICSAIRSWHEGETRTICRPTLEATRYVADLNPKLAEQFWKLTTVTREFRSRDIEQPEAKQPKAE